MIYTENTHPQTGAKHRISCFYAVNAGTVSNEVFFSLLQNKHGDNVRPLEGRDLLALDRSAAFRDTIFQVGTLSVNVEVLVTSW